MRKLLLALGATFVVLLGTGLYQAFRYRPYAAQPWNRIGRSGSTSGVLYDLTELVHRIGAYVFAALVVAVIVAWIVRARGTTRSTFISVVVLTVLALATLAQLITGRGIRWTQLALWAVRVGTDIRGVVGFDHVKYVLFGSQELSWSEFSTRVFLHLVLFPIGLVLCGAVLWFLSVRDDRRLAALGGSPDDPDGNDHDTPLDAEATEAST